MCNRFVFMYSQIKYTSGGQFQQQQQQTPVIAISKGERLAMQVALYARCNISQVSYESSSLSSRKLSSSHVAKLRPVIILNYFLQSLNDCIV